MARSAKILGAGQAGGVQGERASASRLVLIGLLLAFAAFFPVCTCIAAG